MASNPNVVAERTKVELRAQHKPTSRIRTTIRVGLLIVTDQPDSIPYQPLEIILIPPTPYVISSPLGEVSPLYIFTSTDPAADSSLPVDSPLAAPSSRTSTSAHCHSLLPRQNPRHADSSRDVRARQATMADHRPHLGFGWVIPSLTAMTRISLLLSINIWFM
jgi:hypothetical protein